MTIPPSFATRAENGVTRVTGLQNPQSLPPQGFARNPFSTQALPCNPDEATTRAERNPATGDGVTHRAKTGYAQTPASQGAAGSVTLVTRVTPIFEPCLKISGDASLACDGLPVEDGPFLPWGPYLTADDVRRMRGELRMAIDELAACEGWPRSHKSKIMAQAMNGSAANLLADLAHFAARFLEQRAQAAAREALAARTWRGEGLDDRRA
ncbi:hypothetical protein [Caballeronia grimmiae]|uniref:hypothetical protein n=1 Tax=Caballeronia grimmiae TaxID=1071679 RepID=UPI0038B82B60